MSSRRTFTTHSADVVILGGGGAAALAALAARESGATVALITKESSLVGGATIMSAGGTSAPYTEKDSPDTFLADILKTGGGLNNPRLVRIVADGGVPAVLNLEKYGYLLDRKDANTLRTIKQGEGHAYPRGMLDRREALGFCHALGRALMRNDIRLFTEMIVARLLVKDGRVVGALAFSLVTGDYVAFSAKSVILATGGLGALYKLTTNSAILTGDGYAMAFDVGAELIDMEMVQFFPINFPYPPTRKGKMLAVCSHFGSGVKLYNGLGERYMANYDPERLEFTTRDIAARANFMEIKQGRGTKNGAIIVDPRDHDPNILQRFKTSVPHIYAMFREVYGEKVAEWQEPFEAIPSQHFFMGGVRIDEECKTTIPGLFAVGEVSGGMHGANRLSGTALTEIFVFGPLVGKIAALDARGGDLIPFDRPDVEREIDRLEEGVAHGRGSARPFELKDAIQSLVWDKLGPVREEAEMKEAVAQLESIRRTASEQMAVRDQSRTYNRDRMEAIEVPFMIATALLMVRSALLREESRGGHYRSDFPLQDDNKWLRNVVVMKGRSGDAVVEARERVR
ncbi:MAG TPA: FAD-binding protein [Syntrophorhabdales bacterium]|nr:FAD-binding protein [Syntrophorhabdales bacterium]